MKNRIRIFGALFAAVVGGCAGTKSTVVPISPVSSGAPVDADAYELQVDGQPAGSVLVESGRAVRDHNGDELVRLGMKIDNKTGQSPFQLPVDQIYLTNIGPAPLKLVKVDNQPASTIVVPAGQSRAFELTFMSVEPIAKHQLDNVQVHWTLLIDGSPNPIVRTTAFRALSRQAARDRDQYARQYDIPAVEATHHLESYPYQVEYRGVGSANTEYFPGDNRFPHTRVPRTVQEKGQL